uniref:Uncharacterized protein n=1 Tax=Arundo donax TaxID=35708 RepID=A0A0A9B6N3_ARUDO
MLPAKYYIHALIA